MRYAQFSCTAFTIASLSLCGALAQQPTPDTKPVPAPATYTGCVMQSPNVSTVYLLATKDRCLVLSGKYDVEKAAGHEVEFKGTLAEAVGNKPPSLNVQSVVAVKDACSHTCTLPPPGHRGLNQTSNPDTGADNAQPAAFPPPKKNSSTPPHP